MLIIDALTTGMAKLSGTEKPSLSHAKCLIAKLLGQYLSAERYYTLA